MNTINSFVLNVTGTELGISSNLPISQYIYGGPLVDIYNNPVTPTAVLSGGILIPNPLRTESDLIDAT